MVEQSQLDKPMIQPLEMFFVMFECNKKPLITLAAPIRKSETESP